MTGSHDRKRQDPEERFCDCVLEWLNLLGPAFGRTDFSRIFFFEPPHFSADFLAGFFLLIFRGFLFLGRRIFRGFSRRIFSPHFSRIFIFWAVGFFADFLAGFFLLIFVGKSAQKNPPGKSRENPPKFIQRKSSNTFLQIAQGKIFGRFLRGGGTERGVCDIVWQERAQTRATQMTHMPSLKALCLFAVIKLKAPCVICASFAWHREQTLAPI